MFAKCVSVIQWGAQDNLHHLAATEKHPYRPTRLKFRFKKIKCLYYKRFGWSKIHKNTEGCKSFHYTNVWTLSKSPKHEMWIQINTNDKYKVVHLLFCRHGRQYLTFTSRTNTHTQVNNSPQDRNVRYVFIWHSLHSLIIHISCSSKHFLCISFWSHYAAFMKLHSKLI